MRTDGISVGEAVKELRKARNITKEELAELAGISVSHLEKIETGARMPGIGTYQRLLKLLDADMVIHKETESVQEKCVGKVQTILLNSTEAQAVFMTNILETIARNIEMVI